VGRENESDLVLALPGIGMQTGSASNIARYGNCMEA
jgi:hypothetical protein